MEQTRVKYLQGAAIAAMILATIFSCTNKRAPIQKDAQYWDTADSLLDLMTLEEKAGQMLNIGLPALLEGDFYSFRDTLIFDTAKLNRLLVKFGAGSVQNLGTYPLSPEEWKYYIGYLQGYVKENTRLKIPILYGIDAIHGANYSVGSVMFPQQINLAATFDTSWAYQVGEITAYEVRAGNIPWNYSPVLDIARNPLWGRTFETFGEDTYLSSQLGSAMITGMQGSMPLQQDKVLACAKHFLAYGAPYNGKDRSNSVQSEQMLRQIHLPPFQEAIDRGLLSIMVSAGSINGLPTHVDKWLITDVLKNELGFKGVVIGDWSEHDNLHGVHRVAADEREAVKKMVLAGIDICMEPYDESFVVHLIDLVRSGEIPESRINDAVRRILYLKIVSGIMTDPVFSSYEYPGYSSKESHELNLEIARESLTLLKNEQDILPLGPGKKVLVTGVAAHSLNYLNGGWSRTWSGQDTLYNDSEKLTILEALQEELGNQNVMYSAGTNYTEDINRVATAKLALQSDVIVACLGEIPATEKPSDINELELPEAQIELVKSLAATGKPIILILVQGRPRIIREIEPLVQAIIMAYLPGNEGGPAIRDVLMGHFNPGGKLPYTWPEYCGSILPYDHALAEERGPDFQVGGLKPQYEFGYGLSYTHFEYQSFLASHDTLRLHDTLELSITLSNRGTLKGKEAVLLYVQDEVAGISPAVKRLRRFKKLELEPGQSETISFTLTSHDLSFVNPKNIWSAEEGYFTLMIEDQQIRIYYTDS